MFGNNEQSESDAIYYIEHIDNRILNETHISEDI